MTQTPPRSRRVRRALLVLAVLTAAIALEASWLLRDPLPRFEARRSALARADVGEPVIDGPYRLVPVRVVATSGLAVNLMLRRALADSGRTLPLAVILGGHYTGRDAVKMLPETPGILVAAMSYPYDGDPRPDALTFLRQIPAIRAAFLDTPPALMVALDYLLALPGVDTTHVEAIGVSLGAPFVCIAGALDPRFTRVWAMHGSGGSYAPLEMNMRPTIHFGPLRALAAGIANVIIAGPRLDPVRWVGGIAPRPFMMVNAADDERLPRSAVMALYEAARQPKELQWMPGGHVHGDSATLTALTEIVLHRVRGGSR